MQTALVRPKLLDFGAGSLVVPVHECPFRRKGEGDDIVVVLEFAFVPTPFDHNLDRSTEVKSGFNPTQEALVIIDIPTGNLVGQRFGPLAGEALCQHLIAFGEQPAQILIRAGTAIKAVKCAFSLLWR